MLTVEGSSCILVANKWKGVVTFLISLSTVYNIMLNWLETTRHRCQYQRAVPRWRRT